MKEEQRKAWEEEAVVWAKHCTAFRKEGHYPHGLGTLILAAAAELTRLRSLEARCGDVEGMLPEIRSGYRTQWDSPFDQELAFQYIARAVSRWLKEGK